MGTAAAGSMKSDRTALLVVFIALLGLTVALVAFAFPAGVYNVFAV